MFARVTFAQLDLPFLEICCLTKISLLKIDGNHWRDVFRSPGLYVAQIFIGLLCIANTILASINLANVIKYRDRRSKFSVPQVILGIQVLANLSKSY
jgi:hypothetical protein